MILPDRLGYRQYIVFCGTAAGKTSAAKRAYYAGPGNRFWSTLHTIGLTPRIFAPQEYRQLLRLCIGVTDLAKRASGSDAALKTEDFDVEDFKLKIRDYQPVNVAFNGMKAAQLALGKSLLNYGLQDVTIHGCKVWVLPSTSRANGHWDITPWHGLGDEYMRLKALKQ